MYSQTFLGVLGLPQQQQKKKKPKTSARSKASRWPTYLLLPSGNILSEHQLL
jgi:hypothetical protein